MCICNKLRSKDTISERSIARSSEFKSQSQATGTHFLKPIPSIMQKIRLGDPLRKRVTYVNLRRHALLYAAILLNIQGSDVVIVVYILLAD